MTGRLLAAIATPHGRYLLRGLREFNGYDGRTVLNRDAVLGWKQNYTPDNSHMTHVHLGWFRDACEDWSQVSDVLSVINGTADLTGATTQGGTATPLTPSEEDDMFDDDDRNALRTALRRLEAMTVLDNPNTDPLAPISAAVAGAQVQTVDGAAPFGVLTRELQSNGRAAALAAVGSGQVDTDAVADAVAERIIPHLSAGSDPKTVAKAVVDELAAELAGRTVA